MITITVESDSGEKFSRCFPGDTFEISGSDTERSARATVTSSIVSTPKSWTGRRCVTVGILERTQRDEPENEKTLRGIEA